MKKRLIIHRLNIAVYAILFLLAIFFLYIGSNQFRNAGTWAEAFQNLSTELLGVVIVFFIAQYFFIWNQEDEDRKERLNNFLLKVEREEYSTVFKTSEDSKYNDDFYKYFNSRIRAASHDIYVTGEGFDGTTKEGRKIAEEYLDAYHFALKRGVNIVRLQTRSYISDFWNEEMKKLLERFPDYFKLYVSNSPEYSGSLCSIDYSDSVNNISEFMLSVPRTNGLFRSKLAGLAVFINKDQQLATDIKDMILSETSNKKLSQQITLGNFEIHMNNNELYFAFGSNRHCCMNRLGKIYPPNNYFKFVSSF